MAFSLFIAMVYSLAFLAAMLPVIATNNLLFRVDRWIQYGALSMLAVYPLFLFGAEFAFSWVGWQPGIELMSQPGRAIQLWMFWFCTPTVFLVVVLAGKYTPVLFCQVRKLLGRGDQRC